MRSCPRCQRELPPESYRPGRQPCIDCIRSDGRERERKRRERDGDRIRAADRARVRNPEVRLRQLEASKRINMAKRRDAGIPARRKGPDPAKLEARRVRINERRRVPEDQRKQRRYDSDDERRAAMVEYRRKYRAGPGGERERARHSERQKERRVADPEGVRARERTALAQWRRDNPEAYRRKGQRDSSKRNALKRNADVRVVTDADLRRLLHRQHGRCAYCAEPEPSTLDHVVPLVRGGRHAIGNLVWACEPCNKSKGGRLVVEVRYGRSYRRRLAS